MKKSNSEIRILFLALAVQLGTIGLMLVVASWFPACTACALNNFVAAPGLLASQLAALLTWDSQHYVFIAAQWYQPDYITAAFYPFYPALVRGLVAVSHLPVAWGALLVSTIASCASAVLLYQCARRLWSEPVAWWSVVGFLAFPTHFFFVVAYPESVFVALVLLGWLGLYKNQYAVVWVVALLLVLTRPQGAFAVVALAVGWWLTHPAARRWWHPIGILAAGVLAGGIHAALLWQATGDPFANFGAQGLFVSRNTLPTVPDWFRSTFFSWPTQLHRFGNSWIDRSSFFGLLALLPISYRRLVAQRDLFWYVVIVGAVPALIGALVSFPRYLVLIFPLALVFGQIRNPWLRWGLLLLGCAVQIIAASLHALNVWVA